MVLKTQPIAPLETIYEESGSFISSTIDIQHQHKDETINGLISARSILPVNIQRQRANKNKKKPPIEVRFRDGSKRYIHPSTTTTMIINRRNLLNSSAENLSSKTYRQIFHSNFIKKKPPLVLTIITAEDLNQVGITPPISSSSSGSDRSTITQSKTIEDIHQDTFEQSSSIPSLKTYTSSLQVSLNKDENEKVKNTIQPNTTKLVEGGTRSAFHPVFIPIHFNQQPISMKPQAPSTVNRKPLNAPQQPMVSFSQQYPSISNVSYKPSSTQIESNINSSTHMNPLYYQQNSKSIDNSSTLPPVLNLSSKSGQTFSFVVNPKMKWVNVTSDSIYDIPRLASKYSSIPLRITLPVTTPAYNQKLVIKSNTALEKRLLNAGLSPDTIALYERILDVAENGQINL